MTLKEFNKINHDERLYSVVHYGVFRDKNVTKDIKINCYAIDKFFVEVVYDGEINVITELRSFKARTRA